MKRSIGVTAVALGLLFTGAFLSPFISNPFASNHHSLNGPSAQAPILLNANGLGSRWRHLPASTATRRR
jgi:hypothetical protein